MYRVLLIVFILLFSQLFCETLKLDIMFTNDVHGGIDRYDATFMNPDFPPVLGGGASAATYIKEVRALSDGKTRENLLVDAGDFFQGHPVGTVSKGKSVIDYMNEIGYELMVIGNHEYDIGEEELVKTLKFAKFPILSCNIIDRRTNELVDYAIPYIILEKMGLRIGIVGVTTTDTELMSFPEHIKNVDFTNAKEALGKYIPIVREQGVDLLIVVGHMGLPYYPEPVYKTRYVEGKAYTKERYWGYDSQELAHEVEGIDLLIGGHMHKGFYEPWEDPVTHTLAVQGYAYGSNVGHITLLIDKDTKTLAGWESPAYDNILITLFEDEYIPDPAISDTILAMTREAEKGMDEVIGESAIHLSRDGNGPQNLIGNLVVESMKAEMNADFAFMNLGGIRADLPLGPITYRDVFNVLPFDSQIVVFECDGNFLKWIIEKRVEGSRHGLRTAGIKVTVDRDRPDFDRVVDLWIGDEYWDPNKIYRVATSDFLMQGNAGLTKLTNIPEEDITRHETIIRDVIVNYIKKNSPVSTKIDNRWTRDDGVGYSEKMREALQKSSVKK